MDDCLLWCICVIFFFKVWPTPDPILTPQLRSPMDRNSAPKCRNHSDFSINFKGGIRVTYFGHQTSYIYWLFFFTWAIFSWINRRRRRRRREEEQEEEKEEEGEQEGGREEGKKEQKETKQQQEEKKRQWEEQEREEEEKRAPLLYPPPWLFLCPPWRSPPPSQLIINNHSHPWLNYPLLFPLRPLFHKILLYTRPFCWCLFRGWYKFI